MWDLHNHLETDRMHRLLTSPEPTDETGSDRHSLRDLTLKNTPTFSRALTYKHHDSSCRHLPWYHNVISWFLEFKPENWRSTLAFHLRAFFLLCNQRTVTREYIGGEPAAYIFSAVTSSRYTRTCTSRLLVVLARHVSVSRGRTCYFACHPNVRSVIQGRIFRGLAPPASTDPKFWWW